MSSQRLPESAQCRQRRVFPPMSPSTVPVFAQACGAYQLHGLLKSVFACGEKRDTGRQHPPLKSPMS